VVARNLKERKIPERELPKIKITEEQVQELRTISAITKILAEDPELTKSIADTFLEASRVSPQDRMTAQIELKEKVSRMVGEKLKDVPVERVAKLFPYWYPHIIRHWIPHYWIPYTHIWFPWGPYER
jgi:hypothetical protein